jgi:hypothetical protein
VENVSTTDRIHIVKMGGMKQVIAAMNSFHDNYLLHRAAIASIQNISAKGTGGFGVSYTLVDYNKLIAGKEGAIDAIAKSMNQFSSDIELQIVATKTLTGLAFGIEYNKVLITARGLTTLINNTNNFRKNPELLIINLGCLANLTSAGSYNSITLSLF